MLTVAARQKKKKMKMVTTANEADVILFLNLYIFFIAKYYSTYDRFVETKPISWISLL